MGCGDLTTDGEPQSGATHRRISGDGRIQGKFSIYLKEPAVSKDAAAFCSSPASSMAAADPPVSTQAERDSDSETHTFPTVRGGRNNMVAKKRRSPSLLAKKNFLAEIFLLPDSRKENLSGRERIWLR